VKVQLHQRKINPKKSPPRKKHNLDSTSSKEYSPDRTVILPKAIEVNPLSAEYSNDYTHPNRMSSMEKRGSINPTSHVSVQDMSAVNNGNVPSNTKQYKIGFV
jgi:hypothetical protein